MMKMEDEKGREKEELLIKGRLRNIIVKETASSPRCPAARASTQASKSVYHALSHRIQDIVSKMGIQDRGAHPGGLRNSYSALSLIL